MENIVVDKARRRQGIGRAMLDFAKDYAVRHNCYKLSLTSNASRLEAHGVDERCGMIRHGYSFRYVL